MTLQPVFWRRRWFQIAAATATGFGLLSFIHLGGHLLHARWMFPLLWLIAPLSLLWLGRRASGETQDDSAEVAPEAGPAVLLVFALLALFSSAARYKWFYFVEWLPPENDRLAYSGITLLVLLTSLALPLFLTRLSRSGLLYFIALVAIQVLAIHSFRDVVAGRVLYQDDHPTMLFRLWVFQHSLPHLVSYNPFWNAGNIEYSGLTTGIVAPGLLLLPYWLRGALPECYNTGVLLVFIVVLPFIAAYSLRIMGGGWIAAWIAAIFTMGVSRYFFLWLFNYGTFGANCVSAFVIPAAACLYRMIMLGRAERWVIVVLAVSVFFCMLWPVGLFMLLPLGLAVLVNARRLSRSSILALAWAVLLLGVLVVYPLFVIMHESDVGTHTWVARQGAVKPVTAVIRDGLAFLRDHVRHAHPLLIFLGLGGALCGAGRGRGLARWFAPILLGFMVLTAWGKCLVPDLPLERMAIPLFFAAVPPAALLAEQLLLQTGRAVLLRAALFALIVAGGWNVARLYANEGPGFYTVMPQDIVNLASWARTQTPEQARIWLAGGTGHRYGGGHVAFLPMLLQREMLSSDYRHDQKPTIETGSPPEQPPASIEKLDAYLALFGVSHIFTLEQAWREYLEGHPERFEYMGPIPASDLQAFRILAPSNRFLSGAGETDAQLNRLTVRVADPSQDAVVRYLWCDGLAADAPAEVFPYAAASGVRLLGIHPHGQHTVTVRFRRWF